MSPNVVLCGDFNAHVGELSDAHTGFVLDCPEVLETRRYVCNSVNKAGQLLVDLAAATSMAITTGRAVGDDGQPSFSGNYGDKKSRPDYVLLSPALYKLVCSFKMWDTCASDPAALSTEFKVNAVGGESAYTKHHVCRIGQCVNNLVLRWQHEKAHMYARHISENMELLSHLMRQRELAMWINWHSVCIR